MSPTRRDFLRIGAVAGAGVAARRLLGGARPLAGLSRDGALALEGSLSREAALAPGRLQDALITKAIPATGERIPVIGLGSAGTFNLSPGDPEYDAAQEVVRLFHEAGGTVIDTSPTYRRSETFLGETVTGMGIQDDLFVATKVNVGDDGREAAFRQMERSAEVWGREVIDLMQVWNLGDSIRNLTDRYLDEHMAYARAWKEGGRARYIGVTTSRDPQYDDVADALERYDLDFVQLDYSIGDRRPEERLLPLAAERGTAVLVNRPFVSGQLFRRVRGRELPAWVSDYGIGSWAQYFLNFIVSHPSVTVTVPATSDPEHLVDNMGAGRGRLPDAEARERMVRDFEGG